MTASAALGDADTMFELLGQYEARGVSFQDLLVDVQILRYRHDVRYHDLLKRTDLLPYAAEAPALGASWSPIGRVSLGHHHAADNHARRVP